VFVLMQLYLYLLC